MRLLLALLAPLLLPACDAPKCAHGDYSASDCRVAAENHHARIITAAGTELRFQPPEADDASSWDALGLLEEVDDGVVRARPAGLMDFAISVHPGGGDSLVIRLVNVAADTVLYVGPAGAAVELALPEPPTLTRTLTVPLGDEIVWIRGQRPCPSSYRIAALGDIQTNPIQFERILQSLHAQIDDAADAGAPLLGLLLLGDLAESAADDEFARIDRILATSPVPVAASPGNHDVAGDEFGLYNRWFGPGSYAFSVCRTRVAMFDTGQGDLANSIESRLPELLDRTGHDHLIAGQHYPAYADRTGQGFQNGDQADYQLAELVRNGADVLLAGHVHYWKEYRGIPVGDGFLHEIISGTGGAHQGEGHPRFGLTRLTVTDTVDTCFVEVPAPGTTAAGEGPVSGAIDFCETP